ncbi:MAG: acyl-CoA dehydrogenase family protein, partial [Bdellovibrionia bacterium]
MNTELEPQGQSQQILETLSRFYKQEVLPVRRQMDTDPQICKRLLKGLGQLGFLAPHLPEEYGGINCSRQLKAAMSRVSNKISPSLGLSTGAHGLLATNGIYFFGSDEQKKRYLPRLASGEIIGAWGVTEPGAGSDVGGMESTAILKGDEYILNGNKTFITNAPICDVAVVYAKLSKDPESITTFIVERGQAGL